eukprot:6173184-Pleurochrysis_carterae.AAC.3
MSGGAQGGGINGGGWGDGEVGLGGGLCGGSGDGGGDDGGLLGGGLGGGDGGGLMRMAASRIGPTRVEGRQRNILSKPRCQALARPGPRTHLSREKKVGVPNLRHVVGKSGVLRQQRVNEKRA